VNGTALPGVSDFESVTGKGVRGRIGGVMYQVGKPDLFAESDSDLVDRLAEQGKTVVLFGTETAAGGAIAVADTVRAAARESIGWLHGHGIRTVMLTGDNESTARAIAGELGIDQWQAGLLPDEKVEALAKLRSHHGEIAMVGDGVNDAPALVAASVGIAMGGAGSNTALETADVVLMADDLTRLPYLFELSRSSGRVIKQNVWTSILVKIILAAGVFPGVVSLAAAVLVGDMGTSLAVTGNALRLARTRP
jgi:Cd2+/Zn2+-exporting ATPase